MARTNRRKGFGYGNLNDDGSVNHVTFRSSRKQRRRQCVCFTVILGSMLLVTLVAVGAICAFVFLDSQQDGGTAACDASPGALINCIPEGGSMNTSETCQKRGCCWKEAEGSPSCFYPENFGYKVDGGVVNTSSGFTVSAGRKDDQPSQYGGEIDTIRVDFFYETAYRLRVRLTDPKNSRYEVPLATPPPPQTKATNPLYNVSISQTTFNFTVRRSSNSRNLFSTLTGLIMSNQFLQLSALLPSDSIYGLGEHAMDHFKLFTNYSVLTLFSRDQAPDPDKPNQNLYGVHPFYLCLETDGSAHGVFLLNSNAMEIELGPAPSITYRTIGGILDFYFFLGPSPEAVVQQYTELIGRPFMPPYWSLGFHLCRWGYLTANHTMEVVQRMREHNIPQDTQWNDIDYMNDHLDFTYNHASFAELPDLVSNLHDHGQHYVLITDPGVGSAQPRGSYPPYDDGLSMKIFITNSTDQPLIGEVWPGEVAFPDFTNPDSQNYWEKFVSLFHSNVSFDGLWIDMNEPSNFKSGSLSGCPNNTINNPPFLPGWYHGNHTLYEKTLCMSANQNASSHYNVHSLYGLTEANATMRALEKVLKKRSLVISRSTYPGSGRHGGHWLGDNQSLWRHMSNSITGILDFTLFGIPLVGADICGFGADTTEQLCTRWMQLGAFYPFSRNHNAIGSIPQDPAVFSNYSIASSRDVLMLRYSILPFLYTLFHFANINGSTVARPLFFEFPEDKVAWNVDTQFMWGSSLLITPVLEENGMSVSGYFPTSARWFDFRNGSEMTQKGYRNLSAPLNTIPLHLRGGSIIPRQEPNTTTTESRKNPFSLLVALDYDEKGEGWLYWDDGESLGTYDSGSYSLLYFYAQKGSLSSSPRHTGYSGLNNASLNCITLYGLSGKPSSVYLNKDLVPDGDMIWNGDTKRLDVKVNLIDLNKEFVLSWNSTTTFTI